MVARAHKTLIWERTRHVQRLRNALREFFPAALEAFDDLTSGDALELLGKAADPAAAARLTRAQITAALRRAGRRHVAERAEQIQTALRGEHSPTAEVYLSQPGLGAFSVPGCCPSSATTAGTRRETGRTCRHQPITRQSGKHKFVLAATSTTTDCSTHSVGRPSPRSPPHRRRVPTASSPTAVGILHGCLKTDTTYDEATAWPASRPLTTNGMGCLSGSLCVKKQPGLGFRIRGDVGRRRHGPRSGCGGGRWP